MSSSEDESGHQSSKSGRSVRRKKLSEVVSINSENSDSIYTSIGKKSMQYTVKSTVDINIRAESTANEEKDRKIQQNGVISSEVLKIKDDLEEIGVDIKTLDEDERKLWLDKIQTVASTLQTDNVLLTSPNDDLMESIPMAYSEDSSQLDRLYDAMKEDRTASFFKVFISFGKERRPITVNGKETLEDVLGKIDIGFTRQPRVYEPESSMYEANLIPVKFHKKTLEKLGFGNLSILHCVCLQHDSENEEPPPGMKKLIFRVGNSKNVQIFASPEQKFSELIQMFEIEYPLETGDKLNVKYHFDGQLIKPEDTFESLEMESGDFIDVFLT